MTYIKERTQSRLVCDGWQCWATLYGTNAVLLRSRAVGLGWTKLGGTGGLGDRCPQCDPRRGLGVGSPAPTR